MCGGRSSPCPRHPPLEASGLGVLRWILLTQSAISFNLPLRFDRHVYSSLRTSGIFSPSPSAAPNLAYLDFGAVSELRDKSVKIAPFKRFNPPINRMREKLLRRIKPENELEDPIYRRRSNRPGPGAAGPRNTRENNCGGHSAPSRGQDMPRYGYVQGSPPSLPNNAPATLLLLHSLHPRRVP